MIQHITIKQRRPKRVARIRALLHGTDVRPRLVIFRSHASLSGQLVDDEKRMTIGSSRIKGKNVASGSALGQSLVEVCKKLGIKRLIFDRGGYRYHGVIKQIADTVREGGITI